MKSDRELTILAAQAAGFEFAVTQPFIGLQLRNGSIFSPLTDDGDSLRLAVKLELEMYYGDNGSDEDGSLPCACATHTKINFVCMEYFDIERDKSEATRRAIVRAAAAIAEQEGRA